MWIEPATSPPRKPGAQVQKARDAIEDSCVDGGLVKFNDLSREHIEGAPLDYEHLSVLRDLFVLRKTMSQTLHPAVEQFLIIKTLLI